MNSFGVHRVQSNATPRARVGGHREGNCSGDESFALLASHVFLKAVVHEAPDVRRPGTVRGPPRRNHVATRSAAVNLRAVVRVPTADDHVGAQTSAVIRAFVLVVDLVRNLSHRLDVERRVSLDSDLFDVITHDFGDRFSVCSRTRAAHHRGIRQHRHLVACPV